MGPAIDTKQRLIDTASELIWKSSYGSVSVDDICKAADVKKGSFYHFFPSKVDLAIAAMEESHKKIRAAYDGIFSPEIPPAQRFAGMAEFTYQAQIEAAAKYGHVCGCPCASLGSEMASQAEGIRAKFEDITRRQVRYFENALRDMVEEGVIPANTDIKAKAQEVYAYMLGQLMIARIQNDLEPMKRDLKAGLLRTIGIKEKGEVAA